MFFVQLPNGKRTTGLVPCRIHGHHRGIKAAAAQVDESCWKQWRSQLSLGNDESARNWVNSRIYITTVAHKLVASVSQTSRLSYKAQVMFQSSSERRTGSSYKLCLRQLVVSVSEIMCVSYLLASWDVRANVLQFLSARSIGGHIIDPHGIISRNELYHEIIYYWQLTNNGTCWAFRAQAEIDKLPSFKVFINANLLAVTILIYHGFEHWDSRGKLSLLIPCNERADASTLRN